MEDTSELFPCLLLLPVVSPDLALHCKRSLPSCRRASPPVLWTLERFSDTRRGARTGGVFCALVAQQLLRALCCRHTSGPSPPQDPHPPRADRRFVGNTELSRRATPTIDQDTKPVVERNEQNVFAMPVTHGDLRVQEGWRRPPDSPVGGCARRPRKYQL